MLYSLNALKAPIVKDRVRQIGPDGFAFIPHRFLKNGHLSSLGRDELTLYLFLVLVANKSGVSFYSYDAICALLNLRLDAYIEARNGLIAKDLIAFDGRRFQVLELPPPPAQSPSCPLKSEKDFTRHDPATIRSRALESLGLAEDDLED